MDEPRYNIRAVERLTGVPAATLRSWERRYGFPAPSRTATARRLYSDREVQAIRWVKTQTERGLSAAQAVRWAQSDGDTTAGGTTTAAAAPPPAVVRQPPPALHALAEKLLEAVSAYDEQAAEAALSAGFARTTPDVVLTEVLTPTLRAVGDRWARGELPTSAEHFATNIVRRRLFTLLAEQPPLPQGPPVVLACVPGEQHELGLLMLALFLRWHGARVIYLGADVPVVDLARCVRETGARAVCLSAVDPSSAGRLASAAADLRAMDLSVTIFAGGAAVEGAPPPPGVVVPRGAPRDAAGAIVAAAR